MAEEEVGLRLTLKERAAVARELAKTESSLEQVEGAAEGVGRAGEDAARGLAKASDRKWARGFAAIARGAKGAAGFVGRTFVSAAKVGAVGAAGLSIALGGVSVKAIGLAGDAAETASAFDTVFGPSAERVGGRLDRLTERFGLYNPELQDAARQFGVFAKAAKLPQKDLGKFSTTLTKAGLDLSSFYNVDPAEAFQALQSGLSGEAEPLRRFGIFLSDATMKAEAASMGLTGELTEQQKVMLRQRIIMKSLGDAQGDLARTSEGYTNQQRKAEGQTKTFLQLMGGPLKTAMTGAYRGFNTVAKVGIAELQKRLPGLQTNAEGLSQRFERWGDVLATKVPGAIDTLLGGWDRIEGLVDGGVPASVSQLGDSFGKLADGVARVDFGSVGANATSGLADGINVFSVAVGWAADHADELASAMPYLVAGFVAYKTAQAAANVAALLAVPLKIAEIAATHAHTQALKQHTVATAANSAVGGASIAITGTQAGVTTAAAGAQRGLNAAMRANPLMAVITLATLLVGGFILLYRNSETVRSAVNGLWNNVLKPFGKFLGGMLLGYIKLVANGWLMMGQFGVRAFRWLLTAAFSAFDGILGAAEAGLGWIPGLGGKIKDAREAFNRFGDATVRKLKGVEEALGRARNKIDELGRKHVTPTVDIRVRTSTDGSRAANKYAGDLPIDGARALGGPVAAGRTYLVGERGAELFRPKVSGEIIPNHELRAPGVIQPDSPRGDTEADIEAAMARDDATLTVGPAWPGGPIVIQVVVDKRVLGEAVLDSLEDRGARR